MRKATKNDKQKIIAILIAAFATNKSVNYIVRQGGNRTARIRALMVYSYEMCSLYGDIFISEDGVACALMTYPHQKRFSLKAIWLDIRLLFQCIGIGNAKKVLARETLIKHQYPASPFAYLWFLGVLPGSQQQGHGSKILTELLQLAETKQLPIYLETSAIENLPFYKKHGFSMYHKEDFSYTLYFLRKE